MKLVTDQVNDNWKTATTPKQHLIMIVIEIDTSFRSGEEDTGLVPRNDRQTPRDARYAKEVPN